MLSSIINLFLVALMPVLEALLITALGTILALNRFNVLGEIATNHLNRAVFYVFTPALVGSYLAKTITFKSFLVLWFMIPNLLLTFLLGSMMGWLIIKFTKAPKHVKGLIVASCSAGNLGYLPIIILPAMCQEKGSPFGAPDVCEHNALAYASLSLAIGTILIWLYAYNIIRISSREIIEQANENVETLPPLHHSNQSPELPRISTSSTKSKTTSLSRIKQWFETISKEFNLNAVFSPSTIAAIIGLFIGMISPLRNLLMGTNAPLHVIGDTTLMIGSACIPCSILILGANLKRGLKGSGIGFTTVIGIIAVRYIFLPLCGILIVKGAILAGLIKSHDKLFRFLLLLQYALPPANAMGTMTQLFGAGQKECSVIQLWTNVLAPITLTLWCTVFLWILP